MRASEPRVEFFFDQPEAAAREPVDVLEVVEIAAARLLAGVVRILTRVTHGARALAADPLDAGITAAEEAEDEEEGRTGGRRRTWSCTEHSRFLPHVQLRWITAQCPRSRNHSSISTQKSS